MPVVDAHHGAARPFPPSGAPAIRLIDLDVGDARLAAERALLTDEERAHADRGVPAVARRRVALRAGVRRLAGEVLGVSPADVPITVGAHGRPELGLPDADVACSRSGRHGLVAVAIGCRLGVDLERVAPWHDGILDEPWLTPSERARLRSLAPEHRGPGATRCWTRKEAVLKGIGTGLLGSPADLEAGVEEGAVRVAGWRVVAVPVPAGLIASLATCPVPTLAEPAAERSSDDRERL